jgi:hypothetical protein
MKSWCWGHWGAVVLVASALGCSSGAEDAGEPPRGDVVATLPAHGANITIEGETGIVAGYFYVQRVDLTTGATEELPGLDDARWLDWLGSDNLVFFNDEFFHAANGKGYFPAQALYAPVILELDLTSGAIRELPAPAFELPNQIMLMHYFGAGPSGLYVETAWPDIRLWEIDLASGAWKQLGPSWGIGSTETGPIHADAEAVYFGESLQNTDGSFGMIRWDRRTSSSSTVAEFPYVMRVTADREHVYTAGIDIMRTPVSGGEPQTLHARAPDDAAISGMVLHGDYLYFSEQLAVKRMPKAGGPVETLASRELPGAYRSLRAAGDKLYWLDDHGDTTTTLRSLPLAAH